MFLSELLNLRAGFQRYFEVVPALTEELRQEGYRIRHEVYCRDLGFEPVRADGLETDRYDTHSVHCLLRTAATRQYVGCVRIIRPPRDDPAALLPFEVTCAGTLDRNLLDPARLDRHRVGEVSRLAVIRPFRRRKGEEAQPASIADQDFGDALKPRFPYIPVGLYLGMIAIAQHQGVETLFVLTERRLALHLSRLGVKITQIGAPVEHRGERIPSMMSVSSIIQRMNRLVRPLYEVIADEVTTALQAERMSKRAGMAAPAESRKTGV